MKKEQKEPKETMKKRLVRLICLILAIVLGGGTVAYVIYYIVSGMAK